MCWNMYLCMDVWVSLGLAFLCCSYTLVKSTMALIGLASTWHQWLSRVVWMTSCPLLSLLALNLQLVSWICLPWMLSFPFWVCWHCKCCISSLFVFRSWCLFSCCALVCRSRTLFFLLWSVKRHSDYDWLVELWFEWCFVYFKVLFFNRLAI